MLYRQAEGAKPDPSAYGKLTVDISEQLIWNPAIPQSLSRNLYRVGVSRASNVKLQMVMEKFDGTSMRCSGHNEAGLE